MPTPTEITSTDYADFEAFAAAHAPAAVSVGFTHGFEMSYLDAGRLVRVMGFAASFEDAHTACLAAKRSIVSRGFKPTGSSEFNLRRFVALMAVPEKPTAPVLSVARAA